MEQRRYAYMKIKKLLDLQSAHTPLFCSHIRVADRRQWDSNGACITRSQSL
jgi:hypothetical protein